MGTKNINGDLNVTGTITQNGNAIGGGGGTKLYLHEPYFKLGVNSNTATTLKYMSNNPNPFDLAKIKSIIYVTDGIALDGYYYHKMSSEEYNTSLFHVYSWTLYRFNGDNLERQVYLPDEIDPATNQLKARSYTVADTYSYFVGDTVTEL